MDLNSVFDAVQMLAILAAAAGAFWKISATTEVLALEIRHLATTIEELKQIFSRLSLEVGGLHTRVTRMEARNERNDGNHE